MVSPLHHLLLCKTTALRIKTDSPMEIYLCCRFFFKKIRHPCAAEVLAGEAQPRLEGHHSSSRLPLIVALMAVAPRCPPPPREAPSGMSATAAPAGEIPLQANCGLVDGAAPPQGGGGGRLLPRRPRWHLPPVHDPQTHPHLPMRPHRSMWARGFCHVTSRKCPSIWQRVRGKREEVLVLGDAVGAVVMCLLEVTVLGFF